FRSIAARVGVSEATVRARYGRLTAEGILQVVAVTNPLGLGYEQALVGIKTSGSPEQAADAIARWPEADYVIATAGQFDLVVELVAADRRHLLDLTSRLRALPDVVSTETFMYLEMWKQLYDWGSGMPKEETTRGARRRARRPRTICDAWRAITSGSISHAWADTTRRSSCVATAATSRTPMASGTSTRSPGSSASTSATAS